MPRVGWAHIVLPPQTSLFLPLAGERDLQRCMIQRWAGKDGFTVTQGPFPKTALVLGMFAACRSSEFYYSHFLALTLTSYVTMGTWLSLSISISPVPRQ